MTTFLTLNPSEYFSFDGKTSYCIANLVNLIEEIHLKYESVSAVEKHLTKIYTLIKNMMSEGDCVGRNKNTIYFTATHDDAKLAINRIFLNKNYRID